MAQSQALSPGANCFVNTDSWAYKGGEAAAMVMPVPGLGKVNMVGKAVGVAKGAKRGPMAFGTGPHNRKIKEVADSIENNGSGDIILGGGQRTRNGERLKESVVPTPGGHRSSRRPDILAQRPDGSKYGINVGRQVRSGAPVKREVRAIYDLEDAGVPMHFVPYN